MGHLNLRGRTLLRDNLVVTITTFVCGVALCVLLFPPVYWRIVGNAADGAYGPSGNGTDGADRPSKSCPSCACHCVNEESEGSLPESLGDLKDVILPICGNDDPDMQEELNKSSIQLLHEELELHKLVWMQDQERTDAAINESISKANQHSEESQRCNQEMQSNEDARQRAQAGLRVEKQIGDLWESRARALGWKDEEGKETPKSSQVLGDLDTEGVDFRSQPVERDA